MTDEQFDEICQTALAYEPGPASASTWAKIHRSKWPWLPTIPEILACGCVCGSALFILGVRLGHSPQVSADPNPVVQKALKGSLSKLQGLDGQIPDLTYGSDASFFLPTGYGNLNRQAH
jgi:hypothetical protein